MTSNIQFSATRVDHEEWSVEAITRIGKRLWYQGEVADQGHAIRIAQVMAIRCSRGFNVHNHPEWREDQLCPVYGSTQYQKREADIVHAEWLADMEEPGLF